VGNVYKYKPFCVGCRGIPGFPNVCKTTHRRPSDIIAWHGLPRAPLPSPMLACAGSPSHTSLIANLPLREGGLGRGRNLSSIFFRSSNWAEWFEVLQARALWAAQSRDVSASSRWSCCCSGRKTCDRSLQIQSNFQKKDERGTNWTFCPLGQLRFFVLAAPIIPVV